MIMIKNAIISIIAIIMIIVIMSHDHNHITQRCDKIEGGTVPINHSSPTNRNLAITRKYPVSHNDNWTWSITMIVMICTNYHDYVHSLHTSWCCLAIIIIILDWSLRVGDPLELPPDDALLEDGCLPCCRQHRRHQACSSDRHANHDDNAAWCW